MLIVNDNKKPCQIFSAESPSGDVCGDEQGVCGKLIPVRETQQGKQKNRMPGMASSEP